MSDDLVLINSVAHKNYSVDEVYTFPVVLCDNDIERDLEYFTSDTLEELSKMFVGVTGIYDQNTETVVKWYPHKHYPTSCF